MDRKLFGQKMRLCRERLGLTQAQLAAKSGLEPSAVSFFETGVRLPSLENLLVVADALGESLDTLTGRADGHDPVGKNVQQLLDRFGAMRDEDRALLLKMAGLFAERSRSPFIDAWPPDEAFASPEDPRWHQTA